jgi:hypothetical protein
MPQKRQRWRHANSGPIPAQAEPTVVPYCSSYSLRLLPDVLVDLGLKRFVVVFDTSTGTTLWATFPSEYGLVVQAFLRPETWQASGQGIHESSCNSSYSKAENRR